MSPSSPSCPDRPVLLDDSLDQLGVSIAHVAPDGRFLRVNRRFCALTGHGAESLLHLNINDITHPDDRAASARQVEALIQADIPHYTMEKRYRRSDGSSAWVSVSRSLVRRETGEPAYFVVVAQDIGDRKAAEAALQEREGRLRSILDVVPDGMIIIDEKAIVESFSKAAERLFGYRADEVVGRNVRMLMSRYDRERHDGYMDRFMTTGERRIIGIGRIVVGQRKDESTFSMELSVGEVYSGATRHFIGFVRDLTERQLAQARLDEMQSELVHMSRFTALGEMASALAHELNQPLTAIANYLKGCRRLLDRIEEARLPMLRDGLDQAAEQALRAGQIIRRLRDFVARGETERAIESLEKLVHEACTLALVGAKESGVTVEFSFGRGADLVYVDRIQIQQVLLNLIRNAIEAMQLTPRRILRVSTALLPDRMIEISVSDTGSGIAPEIAAQLFQPFVTTKSTGMGIGLSICRTIVEAHEGRISVLAGPEGGTLFRFSVRAGSSEDGDDAL